MITSKLSLIDTNVLVYAADISSPFHQRSINLRSRGLTGEIALCISPQILSEFFAVITDPKRVSNPRTQMEALEELKKYFNAKRIVKIYPKISTGEIMIDLLSSYAIKKQEIFDLQLVATMLSNDVTQIYTFNQNHFSKFIEIDALEP
jgi:predicted nucleic acid-binding protein